MVALRTLDGELGGSPFLFVAEEDLEEGLREVDVWHIQGILEEGCYLVLTVTGYSAAYGGYEEGIFLVLPGV